MKKILYETSPKFVDYGAKVRVCFDIEEVQIETEDEEGKKVTKTMYAAYTVYLSHPMNVDNIKAQLMGYGFDEFKSEEVTAEVMLYVVGEDSEQALPLAKQMVVARISQYDASSAVNEFTFGGVAMWLDDATRTKLAKRFDTDEQDGKTDTKLIYDGVSYDLPIQQARAMLHQIESYATACFDKTNEHKAAVMAKRSINTVKSYDYTVGYPEKLNFDQMFSES